MTDLDLFTAPAPSHRSPTSWAAARSIEKDLGRLRLRVLRFLDGREPATREEIARGTGLRLATVCGRVNELLHPGERYPWPALLATDGTRPTSSGCRAEAVTLSAEGRRVLAEVEQ